MKPHFLYAPFVFISLILSADAQAKGMDFVVEPVKQVEHQDLNATSSYPTHITEFNGDIYFIASDNNQALDGVPGEDNLFRLDPNDNSFVPVLDANGNSTQNVSNLTVIGDTLYVLQGTQVFTVAKDGSKAWFNSDILFDIEQTLVLNEQVYFTQDLGQGPQLYRLDDDQAVLIKAFNSQTEPGVQSELVSLNGELYFSANEGSGDQVFKYDPNSGEIEPASDLPPSSRVQINSIAAADGELYIIIETQNSDGYLNSDLFKLQGQTFKFEYELGGLNEVKLGNANGNLVISGRGAGARECYQGADNGQLVLMYSKQNKRAQCILIEGSLDITEQDFNYQILGNHLVYSYSEINGFRRSMSNEIGIVDLTNFEQKHYANVEEVLLTSQTCNEWEYHLNYQCKPADRSYAIVNDMVYTMGTENIKGIELLALPFDGSEPELVDINTTPLQSYYLKPLHGDKNKLFVQPYLTEQERDEFTNFPLELDILSKEIIDSRVSKRKAKPQTAYLNGVVYKAGHSNSIFSYQGLLYELTVEGYANKVSLTVGKNNLPYTDKSSIDLAVKADGIANSAITQASALVGDDFYFTLDYEDGKQRLYRYSLTENNVTLLKVNDTEKVIQIAVFDDEAHPIVQTPLVTQFFRLSNDQWQRIYQSVQLNRDKEILQEQDKLYFIEQPEGEPARLMRLEVKSAEVEQVVAVSTGHDIQSFALDSGNVYYLETNEQGQSSAEFKYLAADSQYAELVMLPDGLTSPLDLLRFDKGIYFQALTEQAQPALFSLSQPDRYMEPKAELVEAKPRAKQGELYQSKLSTDPSYQVYVASPEWLSFDKATGLLEGTPDKDEYTDSVQNVEVVLDNGSRVAKAQYQIEVTPALKIASIPFNTIPDIKAGDAFSYQIDLSSHLHKETPVTFSLNYGSDLQHTLDASIDATTGLITGTTVNIDVDWDRAYFEVTATQGEYTDSVHFTSYIVNAGEQTSTPTPTPTPTPVPDSTAQPTPSPEKSSSGGSTDWVLLLLSLCVLRRQHKL